MKPKLFAKIQMMWRNLKIGDIVKADILEKSPFQRLGELNCICRDQKKDVSVFEMQGENPDKDFSSKYYKVHGQDSILNEKLTSA